MQRERHETDDVTVTEMFRYAPVQSGLFSVGPVVLAIAQLANSAFNGLAVTYSVAFAFAMVVFAVLITQHHLVEFRVRKLESALEY